MKTTPTIGLRQRIEFAKNENEIFELLKEGEQFEHASRYTRSSWGHTARRRIQVLNNQ